MTPPAMAARRVLPALMLVLVASACELVVPGGAGPLRYRDAVFTDVTTTSDIVYGEAPRRDGAIEVLELDVYEPTGDTFARRPLVIWVHGGGFAGGSKTSPEIVDEATTFAKKGYVNASISYRLGETRGCTSQCVESIYDAIEDAQAAVRFFRAHAGEYRIDPDRIAIAGTSAGAITALNVGYATPVPGNSGSPGYSSRVRSAVSLSGGAIFYGSIGAGDAPALMLHGMADGLVPFSWAQTTLYTARSKGLTAELVGWEGEGHLPYGQHRDEILELTANFLYANLDLAGAATSTTTTSTTTTSTTSTTLTPATSTTSTSPTTVDPDPTSTTTTSPATVNTAG